MDTRDQILIAVVVGFVGIFVAIHPLALNSVSALGVGAIVGLVCFLSLWLQRGIINPHTNSNNKNMYIIREVFICKPGQASKFAAMMNGAFAGMPGSKFRVMTDFASDFNKVVIEHEAESLAQFEKEMQEYKTKAHPEMTSKMAGYTDMYLTGSREIYQVIA